MVLYILTFTFLDQGKEIPLNLHTLHDLLPHKMLEHCNEVALTFLLVINFP
jgi:hypothetical protein